MIQCVHHKLHQSAPMMKRMHSAMIKTINPSFIGDLLNSGSTCDTKTKWSTQEKWVWLILGVASSHKMYS